MALISASCFMLQDMNQAFALMLQILCSVLLANEDARSSLMRHANELHTSSDNSCNMALLLMYHECTLGGPFCSTHLKIERLHCEATAHLTSWE